MVNCTRYSKLLTVAPDARLRWVARPCCLAAIAIAAVLNATPCFAQTPPPTLPTVAPLTLSDTVSVALSGNHDLAASYQQLLQARARVDQARAGTQATLSFSSQAGGSSADVPQPPPSHETFGSIQNSLNVPLPIGRKPGMAVDLAVAQARAAEAQYESARMTLQVQLSTAFYDVLKKQALAQDAQTTLSLAQRQQDEAKTRSLAGDVPDLDVLRAGVPVASAQASIIQTQNEVDLAKEALNALLGRQIETPLELSGSAILAPPIVLTQQQVEDKAVAQSAALRATRDEVGAGNAALQIAKHWQDPTVGLQISDTRSGDVTSFSREDLIFATITVPLNDGGLAHGQVEETRAAIAQANAEAESALLTVQAAAGAAYGNAVSLRRQADAAKVALDVAQTAYDETVLGYRNGLFPLTDVLNAQSSLTQTRNAYTEALYDAQSSTAVLEVAIGEPLAGAITR